MGRTLSPSVKPHAYQARINKLLINWLKSSSDSHKLIASPTGTGKSFMELWLHNATKDMGRWMLSPKLEIIADILEKGGIDTQKMKWSEIIDTAWSHNITTPKRFHNRLVAGDVDVSDIGLLLKDEAHHDNADTYQEIDTMLPEGVRHVGFTATPYRGNPKSTSEFLRRWGQPEWAIGYPEAIESGYITLPKFETWGLVDDDLLEVGGNGEFVISKLTATVANNIEHALDRTRSIGWWSKGKPCRPTLIGVPSSGCMPQLELEAGAMGLRIAFVTDETSPSVRRKLFKRALDCEVALCHINVISEGVDLAIRNYLDLAPVMSPNLFMQRCGRTTRPLRKGERQPSHYICTNRNLERHGYLWDGAIPLAVFKEGQEVFNGPQERSKVRVFGIQTLGRLQGFKMRLTDGLWVNCYNITHMDGHKKTLYLVVLHPTYANPLWMSRQDTVSTEVNEYGGRMYDYGKWKLAEAPDDVQGFKSTPPGKLTQPQIDKWNQCASSRGLDPTQDIDRKKVELMFGLLDVGASLVKPVT